MERQSSCLQTRRIACQSGRDLDPLLSIHGHHNLCKHRDLPKEVAGWMLATAISQDQLPASTTSNPGPGDAVPPAAPRGRCWAGSWLASPLCCGLRTRSSRQRKQPGPCTSEAQLAQRTLQQSVSALARLHGDMAVPRAPEVSGLCWGTLLLFLAASRGLVTAFKIATPYSLYVCPEGQNVTLTCRILGPVSKGHDVTFYKTWYLSSRGEVQMCKEHRPIRNFTFQHLHPRHGSHQTDNTSHDQAQTHGLELASDHHGNFSITLRNVTLRDSGLYCCLVVEMKHHHPEQRHSGYMELQVQTGKDSSSACTAYQSNEQDSDSITAAALATGACIVGILCLPLILLLVYKQRQRASQHRAQELVRMDSSNIQGIENPGFETIPPFQGMPEAKTRPPLTYVAQRQPSESGRHLLSEPSTPLSPPGPGDVFFPSLDPVPDSPNSEAI